MKVREIPTVNGPLIITTMNELVDKHLKWAVIESHKTSQPYNERVNDYDDNQNTNPSQGIEIGTYIRHNAQLEKREQLSKTLLNKIPYKEYMFFDNVHTLIEDSVLELMDHFAGQLVAVRTAPRTWTIIDVDRIKVVYNQNGFGLIFETVQSSISIRVFRNSEIDKSALKDVLKVLDSTNPHKKNIERLVAKLKM